MPVIGWLIMQAVSGEANAFDLAKLPPARSCTSGSSGDIVVCGDRSRYRLEDLPDGRFEDKPLRADMRIGNAQAGLRVETKELPGAISQRVMVKLKLPF